MPATQADPALDVVVRYLAAMDRCDVDAILSCFTEDVEFGHASARDLNPEATKPYLVGQDQLRAFLEKRGTVQTEHHVTGFAAIAPAPGAGIEVRPGRHFVAVGTGRKGRRISGFSVMYELGDEDRIRRCATFVDSPFYNLQLPDEFLARFDSGF